MDTSYGVQVFGQAGEGPEPVPVSLELQYLQPGTTYHYRLVAISPAGTSYGADAMLTTPVYPTSVLSAPASAPLLATPAVAFPTTPTETTTSTTKTKPKAKTNQRRRRKPRRRQRELTGRPARPVVTSAQGKAGDQHEHPQTKARGSPRAARHTQHRTRILEHPRPSRARTPLPQPATHRKRIPIAVAAGPERRSLRSGKIEL